MAIRAFTRDGRLLSMQIEDQYVTNEKMAEALTGYEPAANMVNYVQYAALPAILGSYITTAELVSALLPYATTSAVDALLTSYITASELTSALANYATVASLSAYTTTVALTATLASYALQSWVIARTFTSTALTGVGGTVTFQTPAGQFTAAPKFQFSAQAPDGSASVYSVQQDGPVVESGSPGALVYTVSAKVNQGTAVTVLAVSVLGMQSAPANVPVTCMAIV